MPDKEVFKNIDHKNKAVAVPMPDRINDIDTKGTLYDNIIETADNGTLDLNALNSFTSISQSRDEVYNMLDIMAEDPIISTALSIYASDATETNDKGQIVWAESENENVLGMTQHLLDQMNVDKNAYNWVYSLIKYGDIYLRLYRNSEYNFNIISEINGEENKESLNEDLIVKAYSKDDHFAEYMEMNRNPAEVFDLQKFGKTVGYIRSHIVSKNLISDDAAITNNYTNSFLKYNFNKSDVDLYPATDYVHACLIDNSSRTEEEVNINNAGANGDQSFTYTVKRGQSILYNSFRIWRELSLLENSVLLNRITKSAITRLVQVEVGDMEKNDIRVLLQRIKSMVEQKSAINIGTTYEDYTNPGPIENIIYVPTHDGKGAITTSEIGGEVNVGDLVDLDYFKNKLFGSLGIPKQYLGDTDDATGFNGGTSLSLISSQYAKNIKRIQNTFCQAITDAINIILLDKGLTDYINEFTIKMQAPTTQEEKDRKDNLTTSISNIREIMSLVEGIEDQATKLNILKTLLSNAITDVEVITAIQDEIDRLENGSIEIEAEGDNDELGGDLGALSGGPASTPMDLGDFSGEEGGEEELPTPEEAGMVGGEEPPEENFLHGNGGVTLNERDNLPSWAQMGMSYTDVR